ncbi:hypothetical protein LJB82_02715 [Desulfovibrio sp. OttesenSCG-928-M16]|nr:hypothetical protein [Desulfovibrio sp. OttesenSCG-928-M16]
MKSGAKYLLAALLVLGAGALVYLTGYSHAEAKGRAALETAQADMLRALNERMREQARQAFLIDLTLQKERSSHAQEKKELLDRLGKYVGSGCLFGADFIRLWNEAINAESADSPGARGSDATAKASGRAARALR